MRHICCGRISSNECQKGFANVNKLHFFLTQMVDDMAFISLRLENDRVFTLRARSINSERIARVGTKNSTLNFVFLESFVQQQKKNWVFLMKPQSGTVYFGSVNQITTIIAFSNQKIKKRNESEARTGGKKI